MRQADLRKECEMTGCVRRVKSADHNLPLVLIPGFMGTALSWRYQMAFFRTHRQVIVPNQHYALTRISDMAHVVAATLPQCFDLVGWSMGGYIAFELYSIVATRIRRFILISTTARPETPMARAGRGELLRNIERDGIRAVYTREINRELTEPGRVDTAFKDALVTDIVTLGDQILRNQIDALVTRADSRSMLGQIDCDVLVLGGRKDLITPVECLEELAALMPRAALTILDDVGHCSPWEMPDDVNRLVEAFLL